MYSERSCERHQNRVIFNKQLHMDLMQFLDQRRLEERWRMERLMDKNKDKIRMEVMVIIIAITILMNQRKREIKVKKEKRLKMIKILKQRRSKNNKVRILN